MGFAKAQMMQQWEDGWSSTGQHVCSGCVDDDALRASLDAATDADEACDFCEATPAADMDVLLDLFVGGLKAEYAHPDDEGVYFESREGGYQWSTQTTAELVEEHAEYLTGPGLVDAVIAAMVDQLWVEIGFAGPRHDEALWASWERFCTAVKYETRYVFFLRPDQGDEDEPGAGEISAGQILHELGNLLNDDDLNLVHELPAGFRLWRARAHDDRSRRFDGPELGTAPRDRALQANRMSPAGIPMFYGATQADTAIRETAAHDDRPWTTVGSFQTTQPCTVIDFTRLRAVPSMFDPAWRGPRRRALRFLHQFVDDLSKPIRSPKHDQIDYVPTQIVTEYLLRIFDAGAPVSGLLYPSAITGAACAVLDVPHDRCVDSATADPDSPLMLELLADSVETRALPSA